jgi:hypothetical protein
MFEARQYKQILYILIDPLRHGARKRRQSGGRSERNYIKRGEQRYSVLAMKVPGQCPFILLVKIGWKEGKALGSGESRAMRELEQRFTAFDRNFEY